MIRALVVCLLLACATAASGQVRVEDVRLAGGTDGARVVFGLSEPVEHRIFTLEDPHRVVIDFTSARMASEDASLDASGRIQRMRHARRENNDLRVVLDLESEASTQSFLMEPRGSYGHRLVVDLEWGSGEEQPVRTAAERRGSDFIVAIDAGHGGRDPGAIGPAGTMEKTVVLAVARQLAQRLDETDGIEPLLIRDGDTFVPLHERRQQARRQGADIFVSLHADAVASGGPRGSSVYTLSRSGASSQAARMLAERENSVERLGEVELSDKDDLTRSVLVDLSRGATLEASVELADDVLDGLAGVGRVHKSNVERAGFAVLKSLDMPSVLVELAFISNPREEQLLQQPAHQRRLALALAGGIERYMSQYRPDRSRGSSGQYEVQRGDTLNDIARSHQVSVSALRQANGLDNDQIRAGAELRIPN